MKNVFKILWLKLSINKLNRKRREAVLDICVNQPKEVNRVNCIEDINPSYFKKIDNEIKSKKKLIEILNKKSAKKSNNLLVAVFVAFLNL